MLLEFQTSSQPLAKRLILNFFHQSFLSRDAYDRALGRDVINGRSKLTSQRQFASVREKRQWIASVIASSTVGGSLGPFDRDKARQNITLVPANYTQPSDRAVFFPLFLVFAGFFKKKPFRFQFKPFRIFKTVFFRTTYFLSLSLNF